MATVFRRLPGKRALEADIERGIAHRFRRRVEPGIRSKTLRQALSVIQTARVTTVGVPHYWAIYYHDGRGPAYPRRRFLVWFRDWRMDPRLPGHLPVFKNEVRDLRTARPDWDWRMIRRLAAAGVVVIASVSPEDASRVEGQPFFDRALQGFPDPLTEKIVETQMHRVATLATGPKERDTVVLKL